MKTFRYNLILCAAVVICLQTGCKKDDETNNPTDVKIIVKNEAGNVVEGATVTLFYTGSPVASPKVTDASGTVLFPNVPFFAYLPSWYAEKGCENTKNNDFTSIAITPFVLNTFTTVMHETGTARIALRSTGTYTITSSAFTGTRSGTDTFYIFPNAGSFILQSKLAGLERKDTVQIACGDTTDIIVP
jgi:hypothetical protein